MTGWASLSFAQQVPIFETSPLSVGLRFFSSAPLPDGDVIVYGGTINNISATNQSWIYDWKSETWSAGPVLAFAAAQMQSVVLSNGDLLAVGGTSDFIGKTQKSQLLDVSTMQWQESAGSFNFFSQNYTRHSALALPNDYVLLSTTNGDFASYDPATEIWTEIDEGPLDAGGSPMFWFDAEGEVLFTGAGGQVYEPNDPPSAGNLFYLDPAQPLLTDGPVQLNDGRVITMDLELNFDNDVSLYDPITRMAAIVSEVPYNGGVNTRSSILLPDGKVLSFGFGDLINPNNTKIIQVYDTSTNTWEIGTYDELGPFETPQMHVLPDSSVFAIAGAPQPNPANQVWILNRLSTASHEKKTENHLSLFPNPAADWICLKGMDGITANLTLCKPDGSLLAKWPMSGGAISLNANLPKGIYCYFITDEQGHFLSSGKLMIK